MRETIEYMDKQIELKKSKKKIFAYKIAFSIEKKLSKKWRTYLRFENKETE